MSRAQTRGWVDWLLALSLAVASAGVVIWQNSRLAVLWDLSYILENSYRISIAQIPYRDFVLPYAPLTFLTQAALIKLAGRVFFHHVIYCAVIGGLGTLLTWRILLHVLQPRPAARLLALVLTVPLTVLGVYAIFPHPFYDSDCTFAILVCLFLLLRWGRESTSIVASVVTGAALVIPLFIKQNVGLAFIVSIAASLVLLGVIDLTQRRSVRKYISLFAGMMLSLAVALFLIHITAGLGNYIQWTVRFAAQRRTPAVAEMIGVYRDPALKWWLALFLLGAIGLLLSRARPLLVFAVTLMSIPFVWPVVYLFLDNDASERAERLVNLWPLVLILSLVAMVVSIRRRSEGRIRIDLLLPLVIIATVHGAFMSQQLWGSTYALWPLFMILVTTIISVLLDYRQSTIGNWPSFIFASLVSVSLLSSGFFYMRSHERLDYANLDDGDLTHSKLPPLKGLATRGSWLTDFEELVAYSNKEIPRDDGILYLPGEDLFYYTTGRQPRFPVLMFDHTVNPYSPQEIVDLARARNIKWLIVKDELQLEEEPLEKKDELINLLLKDFKSVESLDNYEIYKRRSPDDKDSDEDDSNDNDSDDDSKPDSSTNDD